MYFSLLASVLSACGGSKTGEEIRNGTDIGFSPDYVPPDANFDPPSGADPNFEILKPILDDPYWIKALEMYDGETVVDEILDSNDRLITYSFPVDKPDYIPVTILGWAPATQNMITAGREIFSKLEELLDNNVEESRFLMASIILLFLKVFKLVVLGSVIFQIIFINLARIFLYQRTTLSH